MKQIQVRVPSDQADVVEDMLDSFSLQERTTIIETRNNILLFTIRVENSESNNLLHELKARGVGDVFGDITVVPISLHIGSGVDKARVEKSAAANLEEILADIESNATLNGTYVMLVIISGALAAFGLIDNSTVIIIGSMIVAPLLAPVALTSIGFLLPQRGILRKGLLSEMVGVLLTIIVGFIIGFTVIQFQGEIEQTPAMKIRAEETVAWVNILFSIFSGIAAGVIISRGQGLSIVGVAIAASLAPPAANIGLYLAMNNFNAASIAAALLFMNIFSINVSCSIIFTIYKLPSKAGISKRRSTRAQRINNLITLVILVMFILLSVYLFMETDFAT